MEKSGGRTGLEDEHVWLSSDHIKFGHPGGEVKWAIGYASGAQ